MKFRLNIVGLTPFDQDTDPQRQRAPKCEFLWSADWTKWGINELEFGPLAAATDPKGVLKQYNHGEQAWSPYSLTTGIMRTSGCRPD